MDLMFLHENLGSEDRNIAFDLTYTHTKLMAADIHTKGFSNLDEWLRVCALINVLPPGTLFDRVRQHQLFSLDCTIYPESLPPHETDTIDISNIVAEKNK